MKDRIYEIAINPYYDGYQRGLTSMVYKFCWFFLDKKKRSQESVNKELSEELNKPVIKKIKRRKVYAGFEDNIWAPDLAEMGSLSSSNCSVKYLLCVIDVFTKYVWVKCLQDKKG